MDDKPPGPADEIKDMEYEGEMDTSDEEVGFIYIYILR